MKQRRNFPMLLLAVCLLFSLCACGAPAKTDTQPADDTPAAVPETSEPQQEETALPPSDNNQGDTSSSASGDLLLEVNGHTLTAAWADNSSAEALKEILADGPLTISMRDYGSMEKVGPIGQDLPTNNEQITTEAGDLILYQGNAFVIYYAPNSWNFTRLGKINDVTADELKEILGSGDVSVTLSLAAEE